MTLFFKETLPAAQKQLQATLKSKGGQAAQDSCELVEGLLADFMCKHKLLRQNSKVSAHMF